MPERTGVRARGKPQAWTLGHTRRGGNDPPETWQTVQRLARLGYDWHNVMHMIMGPVSSFLYQAMTAKQPFEREVYRRQLNELPGDWPSPEEIGRS